MADTYRIKPVDMFHTPENWEAIQAWIERHSPEDRPHLYTAAMMAWNLAAELTKVEEPKPLEEILGPDENVGS